ADAGGSTGVHTRLAAVDGRRVAVLLRALFATGRGRGWHAGLPAPRARLRDADGLLFLLLPARRDVRLARVGPDENVRVARLHVGGERGFARPAGELRQGGNQRLRGPAVLRPLLDVQLHPVGGRLRFAHWRRCRLQPRAAVLAIPLAARVLLLLLHLLHLVALEQLLPGRPDLRLLHPVVDEEVAE